MERIFGRPIVTQEEMRARIRELGKQITTDYTGKDFVLVGVLKGAYAFYADLARAIRIPMRVDFLMVKSEGARKKTSGKAKKVKVVTELTEDIKGKDVLLDIDVQGALQVRYSYPDALMIFILPPDEPTLLERLKGRARDDAKDITRRFRDAKRVIHMAKGSRAFDHMVINDDLDRAVAEIRKLIANKKTGAL